MSEEDVCFRSLSELSELIRKRALSPVELTTGVLNRISRVAPQLNCYLTIISDHARRRALEMEELLRDGSYLGPLHGIPISLKDNIATAGVRTTAGSPILADWIPTTNATVVERLQAAGAVLVAKANLYEFAYGAPHARFGPTRNPWNLERTCSGSSSGSASAVAAGLCYGSIGTDTGGSIRGPAAFCAVVGVKPTYGRVSRAGVIPVSYNLDHVGPMARTVRDAALLLQSIAGYDEADPTTADRPVADYTAQIEQGLSGLRVGAVQPEGTEKIDSEVWKAVQQAYAVLERERAAITEVRLPDLARARTVMQAISAPEAAEYHREYLRTRAADYDPLVRSRLEVAEFIPATEYVHAQRVRQRMIESARSAFANVDALVMPAVAIPAFRIGARTLHLNGHDEDILEVIGQYTPLFNLLGWPAMVVPCGFSSEGLPIGLQIVGHPFDEATMLQVARAYERATDWHLRRPVV